MSWSNEAKVISKIEREKSIADQEKQAKLAALDLPSWKLALAISGDEQALAELAESEVAKALIRE
jgi:hypothetical protein